MHLQIPARATSQEERLADATQDFIDQGALCRRGITPILPVMPLGWDCWQFSLEKQGLRLRTHLSLPARRVAGGGSGCQDLGWLCPAGSLLVPLHSWFEPKTTFSGAPKSWVFKTPMQLIHLAPGPQSHPRAALSPGLTLLKTGPAETQIWVFFPHRHQRTHGRRGQGEWGEGRPW